MTVAATLLVWMGAASAASAAFQPRIAGGTAAGGGWRAVLHIAVPYDDATTTFCGGTLVAARFVVTAAHCLVKAGGRRASPSEIGVFAGPSHTGPTTASYPVAAVRRHPHFGSGHRGRDHDVAIIRLDEPATGVEPLPLGRGDQEALWAAGGSPVLALGYGQTETGTIPGELRRADLLIEDDVACQQRHDARAPGVFVAHLMLCAGAAGRQVCLGDSGGPLVVLDGNRPAVVGVASFGPPACATSANEPDVFAEVGRGELAAWLRDRVPQAAFTADVTAPDPGQVVTLRSTSRNPLADYAMTWDLDGDGLFDDASGAEVRHAFPSAGRIEVALRATSPAGDNEVARRSFVVAPQTSVALGRSPATVVEGRPLEVALTVEGLGRGTVDFAAQPAGVLGAPRGVRAGRGVPAVATFANPEDAKAEPDRTVSIAIAETTGGLFAGLPATRTVRVLDDDLRVAVASRGSVRVLSPTSGTLSARWLRSGRVVATARRVARAGAPTLLRPRRIAAGRLARGMARVSVFLRTQSRGAVTRGGRARVHLLRAR